MVAKFTSEAQTNVNPSSYPKTMGNTKSKCIADCSSGAAR